MLGVWRAVCGAHRIGTLPVLISVMITHGLMLVLLMATLDDADLEPSGGAYSIRPRVLGGPCPTCDYFNRLAIKQKNTFFLVWTTPESTFMDRHVACLESILFHHPQSSIIIYSNSLPNGKFANYREMGLNVTVREYTITTLRQLVDGMPGQAWLEKYKQWETGRYFFSHLTDFLRFTLLYKYGGTYSDFDAIYVKSVADLDSAVGIDMAGGTECDYCLPGRYYLAPGVLVNFPAGSALLRESMRGFENYSMTCFNCVGPVAITLAARNYSNELTMLPPFFFYPLTYWDVKEWFSRRPRETLEWRKITRNAYSLHLYGFKTNKITPEPNSLVDQALRAFRVQCNRDLDKPLRVPEFIAFEDGHKPFSRIQGIRVVPCDHQAILTVTINSKYPSLISAFHPWPASSTLIVTGKMKEVNTELETLSYYHANSDARGHIDITLSMGGKSWAQAIPLYDLRRLVTVMAKSFGRLDSLNNLIESVRKNFPGLPIVCGDDGLQNLTIAPQWLADPDIRFYRLPFDTGLSEGRNRLIQHVTTPYFWLLDDDFVVSGNSDPGFIVHLLETTEYDILAMKNPVDEQRWGFDFSGLITVTDRVIELKPGDYGDDGGCNVVDVVPNLYIARTERIRSVGWDAQLKLGEHEDFFYRAKQMGIKVGTCPSTWVAHVPAKTATYNKNRARQQIFWKIFLRKHNFTKLISFGSEMATVNDTEVLPHGNDVCPLGFAGSGCRECAPGFTGEFCDDCKPGYWGIDCSPCACRAGVCSDGINGTGCVCPRGYHGVHCEQQFKLGANLLINSELASSDGKTIPGWFSYKNGYVPVDDRLSDNTLIHTAKLTVLTPDGEAGFGQTVTLNQKRPQKILISGYSRAESVSHTGNPARYSLYIDVSYADGTSYWGLNVPFRPGTHDYEYRELIFEPTKAVAYLNVYCLLGEHTGVSYFMGLAVQLIEAEITI